MDTKNYNVDDILSEIKSRKLREKEKASAKSATDDFRFEPSLGEEVRQPRTRDVPEAVAVRTPKARPEPATKPVADAFDITVGTARTPEARPRPAAKPVADAFDITVGTARTPEARPRPAAKPAADVSDIIADAMRTPKARPRPAAKAAADVSDIIADATKRPEAKPRPAARAEAAGSRRPEEFHFSMSADGGEEQASSPLDFVGDVQSITDRARLRAGNMSVARPSVRRFEFNSEFAPEAPEAPIVGNDSGQEHTRVIPKVTGMRDYGARELKTGAAKEPSFGKFALEPDTDHYYDNEPEDVMPEGAVVDYSEYNSASDRRDVQRDIAHVKLWLFIRVSLTLLLTGALFLFTLAGRYDTIPLPEFMFPEVAETLRTYLIMCTALTIVVALVNSSAVGGGLMGLFKMHANSDSLAACAVLATVAQGVAVVANPKLAEPEAMNLYFCVASLAMLFNALGKMTMINRILSNFRIISSTQPKKALLAVESDEFCHEFFKDVSRRPVIAYSVKAGFFTDFLGLSYSDKYDVGINRAVAPVCLAGSLAVGAVTFLLTGSSISAISSIAAILCVCATLSSTFIENVPLARLTKKLAPQGGMVSGNKAVEDFCDVKAIVLTENDLFPPGNVKLHGIKAFAQGRVDEAIVDAASVLCAIDGALGPVFLEMIGGNKKLLKKVDNIVFENAMGISAWVDSRRVLIGNRRLMLNHGVTLPPEVAGQRQTPLTTEAEPLFLSNSGEASAMFSVSYHIDEDLALQLDQMGQREKLLVVHTTDANITAEKIWEMYGYPIELIRILPAEWHSHYQQMSEPRDKAVAEIVYTGKASAMVRAITACIAARSSILSATVIQLIQIVMGYALLTFMAFMGSISTISVPEICAYQIFWFAAIFIVQQVRQS